MGSAGDRDMMSFKSAVSGACVRRIGERVRYNFD